MATRPRRERSAKSMAEDEGEDDPLWDEPDKNSHKRVAKKAKGGGKRKDMKEKRNIIRDAG
jgi:hypothetical protein